MRSDNTAADVSSQFSLDVPLTSESGHVQNGLQLYPDKSATVG